MARTAIGAVLGIAAGLVISVPVRAVFSSPSTDEHMIGAPDSLLEALALYPSAIGRLARDVATVVSIVRDYTTNVVEDDDASWAAAHQRSADKLLALCRANRGIYIKLGQHVAQLDYLLPAEYVRTMEATLREAPTTSMEDVRRTVREELGAEVEDLFETFDPEPIASASLAQVHRARLRTGEWVAVKVQHAGLREACRVDVATIELLVRALHAAFPRLNYMWLVEEIQHNLPRELNFRLEGANAERCARLFAHRRDVAVPRVFWAFTGPRVLTMSFEEGYYIDNTDRMAEDGIAPTRVARIVSECFSDMVFRHGFVHCDPHAGNVLVRPVIRRSWFGLRSTVEPQVVLLDHGLYRELGDPLRLEWARLWRALAAGDETGIRRSTHALGAGEMFRLFAAMLTTKTWDHVEAGGLAQPASTANDAAAARAQEEAKHYARVYANEIGDILASIPRPVLLLLKTNDCLRAIDFRLGSPVNTFSITATVCTDVLGEDAVRSDDGALSTRVRAAVDSAAIRAQVALLPALLALSDWHRRCRLWIAALVGGDPGLVVDPRERTEAVLLDREELDRIEAERNAALQPV